MEKYIVLNARTELINDIYEKAKSIYGNQLPIEIDKRIKNELEMFMNNRSVTILHACKKLIKKYNDKRNVILFRGDIGSLFVAWLIEITDINPLEPHYICPHCKQLVWGDLNKYGCGVDMPEIKCNHCKTTMVRDGYNISYWNYLRYKVDSVDVDLSVTSGSMVRYEELLKQTFGKHSVIDDDDREESKDKALMEIIDKYNRNTQQELGLYDVVINPTGCNDLGNDIITMEISPFSLLDVIANLERATGVLHTECEYTDEKVIAKIKK